MEALDSPRGASFADPNHAPRPIGRDQKENPMSKGERAPKEKKKPALSIKERQDKKKAKQEAKRGTA